MRTHPVAFLLMLLALAGCTRATTCEVVSFHQLPPPAGETIRIEPADPGMADSPQFAATATMIGERLAGLGYQPVPAAAEAQLVARIGYGIEPESTLSLTPPLCSFHYHFGVRRTDSPFWYGYRCRPQHQVSATFYTRHLETRIEVAGGAVLFEGRVRSVGLNDSLPDVMPYLVAAVFANFPGESGVVKTVTIEEDSAPPAFDDQASADVPECVAAVREEAQP